MKLFWRRSAAEKAEAEAQVADLEAKAAAMRARQAERLARVEANYQRADVGARYCWIYGQNPAENARRVLGLPDGPRPHDPEWSKLVAIYMLATPEQRAAMFLVLAGEFVRLRGQASGLPGGHQQLAESAADDIRDACAVQREGSR